MQVIVFQAGVMLTRKKETRKNEACFEVFAAHLIGFLGRSPSTDLEIRSQQSGTWMAGLGVDGHISHETAHKLSECFSHSLIFFPSYIHIYIYKGGIGFFAELANLIANFYHQPS